PQRRPNALSARNLEARFETPVGLLEKPFCGHSRGRVIASYVVGTSKAFLQRLDHKVAALNEGILRPVGVVLQFMISPAVTACLKIPLCCVGTRTGGAIKFVPQYKSPVGFSGMQRTIPCRGLADECRQQGYRYEGKTS